MVVSSASGIEVNGERQVEGTFYFETKAGLCSIRLDCSVEFPTPLVFQLEPNQYQELCDFFSSPSILFWKLVITDHNTNIDTMLVLSFARTPELIIHLSIAAGLQSRHFETPLFNIYSKLEAFFSEKNLNLS